MTQLVRLCVQYSSNSLCKFEYSPHGTGRLTLRSSLTLNGTTQAIDTGIKFMLVSESPEVASPGFYYTVVPYLNPALTAQITEQDATVPVPDPFISIIAYPTGKQGSEMYNLKEEPDKLTLSLRLLLNPGVSGEIKSGSTLCFLTFPVGFDLLNKETCFELT